MHPLPRDSRAQAQELDDDLNHNPNLAIFRQTDNGMLIRMALFALVLDVVDQVDDHAQPVLGTPTSGTVSRLSQAKKRAH